MHMKVLFKIGDIRIFLTRPRITLQKKMVKQTHTTVPANPNQANEFEIKTKQKFIHLNFDI
jgi:hypothetical protein